MLFRRNLRIVSVVVLTTFTSLCIQPTLAALRLPARAQYTDEASIAAVTDYDRTYKHVEFDLRRLAADPSAVLPDLIAARKRLDQEGARVQESLNSRADELLGVATSADASERQAKLVREFQVRHAQLLHLLDGVHAAITKGSKSEIAGLVASLGAFFDQGRGAQPNNIRKFDNLPWRSPKARTRGPVLSAAGFGALGAAGAAKARVAAKAAPTTDDLSETIDIQMPPTIRAKSAELNGNPVAIYNWVRNNIEWVPTYGSIQGSAATLAKKQGNAFDISSLLIALLRASGVPARYSYGTVEIPAAQLNNWVGGTKSTLAAMTLLSAGGVPNISVSSGGVISVVRMEHIWVEVWTDLAPSRGAVQRTPTTWIPIDAAYKQHAFTEGVDMPAVGAFDANAYISAAGSGATVDVAAGSVQNLSRAAVENASAGYETAVMSYLANNSKTKIGDVVGRRDIASQSLSILPTTLPFRLVAQGPRYSSLPSALRHQFVYSLYASKFDRDADSPVWTFQDSLPNLAAKRIVLSFRPASQTDSDLIKGYLPKPHADGSPVLESEIPSGIPALANVTSELKVDGVVVQTGGVFRLGSELAGRGGFTEYDFSGRDLTPDDTLVAGQTSAIGLSTQGIDPLQFEALKSQLQAVKNQLELANPAGLTEDDLSGKPLAANMLSYFVALENNGALVQRPSHIIDRPALSYGLFHAAVVPVKIVGGITTSVKFAGVLMDVGHLRHIRVDINGDVRNLARYNRSRGQYASFLEHAVPERYFVNHSLCGNTGQPICAVGISAIKLLATAESQGQRVFTITAANQNQIDNLALDSAVIDQIRNAVSAGKMVVTHQSPVTIGGWSGVGLEVIDPDTGDGAYLIDGKANGGFIAGFLTSIFCILFAIFILPEIIGMLSIVVIAWEFLNFGLWIASIKHATNDDDFNRETFLHTLGGLVGLIPFEGVAVAELLKWSTCFYLFLIELFSL